MAIKPENSKAAAKTKKPTKAKKPAAKRSTPRAKATKAKPLSKPTQEEIALKAYYIAEERHRKGLPGNRETDWIEAERQLKAGL